VLLLDMIEPPPPEKPKSADTKKPEPARNPISSLFLHRYNCDVFCPACKTKVSSEKDLEVQFCTFVMDLMEQSPDSVETFSATIRRHVVIADDYFCSTCKKKVSAIRAYRLSMMPEITVCLFNIYKERKDRFIPNEMIFPGIGDNSLVFRKVADVEHTGSLDGGHYVARGIRGDGRLYNFNDISASPAGEFTPKSGNKNRYLAFYHFDKYIDGQPKPLPVTIIGLHDKHRDKPAGKKSTVTDKEVDELLADIARV